MRKQYKREDLGKGVRGKYYTAFPTSEAVNDALRGLVQVAKDS